MTTPAPSSSRALTLAATMPGAKSEDVIAAILAGYR
jgi:hypothetical protein